MHYVAIVNGEERQVEITEVAPFRYRVTMDGRTLEEDAPALRDDSLSLLLGHQAYSVESEQDPGGQGENLLVRGHLVHVEVLDMRKIRLRHAQSLALTHDGPRQVTAPMPGKIVAVLVREGDQVASGQGLLVVEAMKMENELRSPKAGVVRQLAAQPGAAVEGGAVLCVVE